MAFSLLKMTCMKQGWSIEWFLAVCAASCTALLCNSLGAERINHEGRILGELPQVTESILFNTPGADAVLSAMQIFPKDSPWNEDISNRPVLANSDAMIAQIIADLRSDRRMLRAFHEMNFALVPDHQPMVPIAFTHYPDESDPSPYPLPSILPVETWPRETGGLTLNEWQRDVNGTGGDRHSITVMPGAGMIWETWLTRLTDGGWEAANGAKFDLNSNALRPFGWTSADAAGLPMFPALVRYDECQRGMVEHAMRIVVRRTRVGPIYPATHQASVGNLTDPNIPAMGQRVRLKASFVIPENWTIYEKAVLKGLKKYGALVADNGNFFSISVTPDDRYPAGAFDHLRTMAIENFEVIQTTGPNEGPRSPGAPTCQAGADRVVQTGETMHLEGSVQNATSSEWRVYSGPGEAEFANPTEAATSVTFSSPGSYILMLSARNGVHTPAYDALRVEVTDQLSVRMARTGDQLRIDWTGGPADYDLEFAEALPALDWAVIATVTSNSFEMPLPDRNHFVRIRKRTTP